MDVHSFLLACTMISFCVIQHENLIFRTMPVNTIIVIILNTNVIKFYCLTSGYGVFLLFPIDLTVD